MDTTLQVKASLGFGLSYDCWFAINQTNIDEKICHNSDEVLHYKHIETETKWPPFCRWHFRNAFSWMKAFSKMFFLEWKLSNKISLKCVPNMSGSGSGNGLVSNIQQAIILTNDCMFYKCTHASLGLNELELWKLFSAWPLPSWSRTNQSAHLNGRYAVLVLVSGARNALTICFESTQHDNGHPVGLIMHAGRCYPGLGFLWCFHVTIVDIVDCFNSSIPRTFRC